MASTIPRFWSQPLRYMKWASIEKPAIFYSVLIGAAGPAMLLVVPPIRRRLGAERIPIIPLTYPVPTGARDKQLKGYDDE